MMGSTHTYDLGKRCVKSINENRLYQYDVSVAKEAREDARLLLSWLSTPRRSI